MDEEVAHPRWPEDEHMFGSWAPQDKRHKYRVCVHPDCKYVEIEEVKN